MCDSGSKVDLLLSCLEDKKHPVKTIVLMEKPSGELVSRAKRSGIEVISLGEMEVGKPFFFNLDLTFRVVYLLMQDINIVIMHHSNFNKLKSARLNTTLC